MKVTQENREEVFLSYLKDFSELTHPQFSRYIPQEAYRFLSLFPDTEYGFRVHFHLGEFYERRGKWNEAVIEYVKCAGLYPDFVLWEKAVLRAGNILDDKLRQEEYAEKYYNRLIEQSPESPEAEQARHVLNS